MQAIDHDTRTRRMEAGLCGTVRYAQWLYAFALTESDRRDALRTFRKLVEDLVSWGDRLQALKLCRKLTPLVTTTAPPEEAVAALRPVLEKIVPRASVFAWTFDERGVLELSWQELQAMPLRIEKSLNSIRAELEQMPDDERTGQIITTTNYFWALWSASDGGFGKPLSERAKAGGQLCIQTLNGEIPASWAARELVRLFCIPRDEFTSEDVRTPPTSST